MFFPIYNYLISSNHSFINSYYYCIFTLRLFSDAKFSNSLLMDSLYYKLTCPYIFYRRHNSIYKLYLLEIEQSDLVHILSNTSFFLPISHIDTDQGYRQSNTYATYHSKPLLQNFVPCWC